MSQPLSIWVTGEPIEPARRKHGSFADMIQRTIGAAWSGDYQLVECQQPDAPLPPPRQVAGVIVTGSPAHAYDCSPWMTRVSAALRDFAGSHTPVLGICFGHQLLGQAFGVEVASNPSGRELGYVPLQLLATDELFEPGTGHVAMAHFDSLLALPSGAQLLATTAREAHAAVRFAPRMWGVQFHPEMNLQVLRHYVDGNRHGLEREGSDPAALLAAPEDDWSPGLLRRFAALCSP